MAKASTLTRLQKATAAHVLPLLVFLLLTEVAGIFRIENSELPWYQKAPEHWAYPLQCLVVGAVLWSYRRYYRLSPIQGLNLAMICGAVGIALWITPGALYERWMPAEPAAWWEWLGILPRREGFNPGIFADSPAAYGTTVALRFLRMVLIVPLVEELFWRSFLMRYVQAGGREFNAVPFGTHSWPAFWITTLAVTLIHQPSDYLAAFCWGSLMYFVAVRTRSLAACVTMHAFGNFLLGLHIMNTQMWGYW
jgi:hypothetical protein